MRKFFFVAQLFPQVLMLLCLLLAADLIAQPAKSKLQKAYQQFQSDPQLKHATSSLYVINAKTGQVVFDKNSQVGLAPASTQKVITATTAFELLGKDYRYKTVFSFGFSEESHDNLFVYGFGDPTLGSWRYGSTVDSSIFRVLIDKIKSRQSPTINSVIVSTNGDSRSIPSGWIYEDLANYYGAASYNFNWRENQYDIDFVPGKKLGDPATIVGNPNERKRWKFINNECKTGSSTSGDNAYLYFIPASSELLIQGTVPMGEKTFPVAASDVDPMSTFSFSFIDYARSHGIEVSDRSAKTQSFFAPMDTIFMNHSLHVHYSPSLDSIIYWFLQKSINLYGEALIKTLAYEKKGYGSTDSGIQIVKDFWKQRGLDPDELNIRDGSGLSPQNRVTTHAQVEVLKYAAKQSWFPYFFAALPEINHMKMKSGTISDVKGFCGYHTAGDGTQYIFSFLVNNYSGSTSAVVQNMYKVLDALK